MLKALAENYKVKDFHRIGVLGNGMPVQMMWKVDASQATSAESPPLRGRPTVMRGCAALMATTRTTFGT